MTKNFLTLMKSAIALTDSLNFSRAAQALHITQPALTKQVAGLEEWVGVRLFERDHQVVALNDAGRAFVEEARLSMLHAERAIQAARLAHSSEAILNIGRSPEIDPFLTSTLLSTRLPLFPQLKVQLSSQFSYDLVHDVLAGTLDLAITTEPPLSPKLSAIKIATSPFYIAMSDDDETAAHDAVSLPALEGREWVLFERRVHPSLYDLIIRVAREKHVTPDQIHHVLTPEEAFPFISQGRGLAFLPKVGALRMARGSITLRPLIEDELLLGTYVVVRADNKSKMLSEFLRTYVRKVSHFTVVKQLPLQMRMSGSSDRRTMTG